MSADAAQPLLVAELPARKSYMTKEQLETYLTDLRSNHPQRPTGARPLSSAAKHRWSTIRSSMSASVPPQAAAADIDEVLNNGPPTLISPTPPSEISRRESKLLRKHSIGGTHKRSNTISSMVSLGSVRGRHSEEAWDGVDRQDGRTSDAAPSVRGRAGTDAGQTASMRSKRSSLRGFASLVSSSSSSNTNQQTRPQSATQSVSSRSSSSSGNSEAKKYVSFDTSGLNSPPSVMMPPCHPPKPEDSDKIEKELNLHFENMSTAQALPTVAPLRINKSGGNSLGGVPGSRSADAASKQTTEGKDTKLPSVPERTATYPGRKEYGTPYPPRKEYVEPWKQEPTQHNKVQYTTNPAPLPSPPGSGSEGEDVEAEILREMGRRPLPRGPTPPEQSVRRNNTKYGAQGPPPPPPVIGIVTSPSPPPVSRTQTAPPTIPIISLPDDDNVPIINVSSAPSNPPAPSINVSSSSTPPVPTISLPGDDASSVPSISVAGPSSSNPRPLPRPGPRPRPSSSVASDSSVRSSRGPTATCNHCRNPIQGRIVSAASLRFHPSCFRCAHCSTSLEHVGFFPEPSEARRQRLESNPEDSNSGIRFYCHLDFHELFSPRCKSCKTPIEGEVVVACGNTWHPGHFFCAECGDPFEKTSRFVEKEGYAWCVGCYTKRYSGKCRKCRQPVIETVVKALGGEWHEECFCCTECSGGFKDGRFFVRNEQGREVPVCVSCEERRLKQ